MNFIEQAKSKLEFVWDGEVRISYHPTQNMFTIHDPIHWRNDPPEERKDFFKEILSNPTCYEAARAWWAELNAELNP